MPKRTDISKILIIGSGPIVIGQSAEFDYSGTQACKALKAEDRLMFKDAMTHIGLDVPRSALVNNLKDGLDFSSKIGFPVILRPSFTLGGSGGGIAYSERELDEKVRWALEQSPTHEVLIEESVLGWKEYELEVMRDLADNVIIICSIENFDPMGVGLHCCLLLADRPR